ncbi:hypothetical protein CLAIMM_02782 [Cladophialophora immunda]|nr:hypothetical protein CLAIMM_02782 [Cladophialophora immunda]
MPIYHIVLFKLKPGVTPAQLSAWGAAAKAMGFNCGIVAILDKAEDVKVYAEHPAHLEVHKFREELCDDTLAYDLEFEE